MITDCLRLFRRDHRGAWRPVGPALPLDGTMPIGVPRLDPERFGWHDLGTDADATHDLDDGAVTFLALPTGAAAVGDLAVRAEQVAYELLSTVPADSLAGLAWRMMSRRAGLTPDDLERVTLWRGIVRRRIPT